MEDAPKRMYLNVGEDPPETFEEMRHNYEMITWCEDKIDDGDIEYIRADQYHMLSMAVLDHLNSIADVLKNVVSTGLLPADNASEIIEAIAEIRALRYDGE